MTEENKIKLITTKEFLKRIKGTQFLIDLQIPLKVNDGIMSRGTWNLITSKRDLSLYCKGIKIHGRWQITPVKKYFGLKGKKESCLTQIEELLNCIEKNDF